MDWMDEEGKDGFLRHNGKDVACLSFFAIGEMALSLMLVRRGFDS